MKETSVSGVICADLHGLPLAAKGIADTSTAGAISSIALQASKLFPNLNETPVISIEGESSDLLIRQEDKIVLGIYKSRV
ncbi:ragulator complex protein LAMTOR5 homolog isoform X2 [Hydractinia symbiolongicarpus]|nr:ragulator complex protein LAMTOR5 homolog isoform X2 [Hydractinia symbiolongicarpus]XP_057296356.1 ragulator complex protein LAMTOR5 homolog isoform X2 [Hydractinia symbiolongicarpus]